MKKSIFITSLCILLALVIFIGANSFYTVNENEFVNVVRFSKTVKTVSDAGLNFKIPFIDTLKVFPKYNLVYDMKPSDVLTADGKSMQVDNYLIWRIEDPLLFYQTLGRQSEAEGRLDMLAYNSVKNVMGTLTRDEIINCAQTNSRSELNGLILEKVHEEALAYGIDVIDIRIKKLDLPADNEQAVYRRMISERNKIAEEYRASGEMEATLIRNEVDKQVNIMVSNAQAQAEALVAEGEAEYMKILAAAYNTSDKQEFFKFMRSLEALEKSLSGDNKTIVLGKDSEIAKLLISE